MDIQARNAFAGRLCLQRAEALQDRIRGFAKPLAASGFGLPIWGGICGDQEHVAGVFNDRVQTPACACHARRWWRDPQPGHGERAALLIIAATTAPPFLHPRAFSIGLPTIVWLICGCSGWSTSWWKAPWKRSSRLWRPFQLCICSKVCSAFSTIVDLARGNWRLILSPENGKPISV